MNTIPIDAIDPEAQHRQWHAHYEYHLDILPPLMEILVMMSLPSIQAARTDKIVVSGGGYIENVPILDGPSPIADALYVWGFVVGYVRQVTHLLNVDVPVPHRPILPPLEGRALERVNADPLLARRHALMLTGWLADHADRIVMLHTVQDAEDRLFAELRHLRARYGVSPHPRRTLQVCDVCGTRAVSLRWIDGPSGSPKPLRAAVCRNCGETRLAPSDDATRPHRAGDSIALSEACEAGDHAGCGSLHCECGCGHRSAA